MASINQLASEIIHITGQPNNLPLRRGIIEAIIHTRNELIRHNYENHSYLDRALQQRYIVELVDCVDGTDTSAEGILDSINNIIKRTKNKVPRPVRLTNNLPFHRVGTVGYVNNKEIAFSTETSIRFTSKLPGMRNVAFYYYTDDYIYVCCSDRLRDLSAIAIEAAFELPHVVERNKSNNEFDYKEFDNEWFIPEDMIGQLKEIIIKRELERIRETNEVSKPEVKG